MNRKILGSLLLTVFILLLPAPIVTGAQQAISAGEIAGSYENRATATHRESSRQGIMVLGSFQFTLDLYSDGTGTATYMPSINTSVPMKAIYENGTVNASGTHESSFTYYISFSGTPKRVGDEIRMDGEITLRGEKGSDWAYGEFEWFSPRGDPLMGKDAETGEEPEEGDIPTLTSPEQEKPGWTPGWTNVEDFDPDAWPHDSSPAWIPDQAEGSTEEGDIPTLTGPEQGGEIDYDSLPKLVPGNGDSWTWDWGYDVPCECDDPWEEHAGPVATVLIGIISAIAAVLGGAAGGAAGSIGGVLGSAASVGAATGQQVVMQGAEALQKLETLGLAAQTPDGRWVKTGDWENATAPGSPLSGYVASSGYGGEELDPNIAISVDPGPGYDPSQPLESYDDPTESPADLPGADLPAGDSSGTGEPAAEPAVPSSTEGAEGGEPQAELSPEEPVSGQEAEPQGNTPDGAEAGAGDAGGPLEEEEPEPPEEEEQEKEPEEKPEEELPPALTPQEIAELKAKMARVIIEKTDEGYFVRNTNVVKKAFWNTPLGWAIEWAKETSSGQCGEFGEWGAEWSKDFVEEVVGEGAIVTTLALERNQFQNHRATKVITPNGERFVFDYWESMQDGEPRIYTEKEWIDRYKKFLGGDPKMIETTDQELSLKRNIQDHGLEKGIELFRHVNKVLARKTGDPKILEKAETFIRSYRREPW